ncbi:MAG: hypothetical protein NTZ33_03135 [Bacteroidetes bacterium]|nr:hypothetical protein [Bacteroidota bacterium]
MKKISMIVLCVMFVMANIFAQGVKKDLEKAQKSGKTIFLIITDKTAKGTENLVKIAENAQKKTKNTAVIKFDRDDKANSAMVAKYRLAGAPLPMVLVVASTDVVTGALSAADATVERLVADIPSKNQSDVLLGFENKKAAFIICGKKNAKDKAALEAECKKAMASLANKATLVFVDVENKEEANFLSLIKPELTKTTVLVFNGQGQYTGTLEATAKSNDILASVNKKMGGGCCPGGSSSSGCGKK